MHKCRFPPALGPQHFAANAKEDVIGQIARFAFENGVSTILAPCHFLREGAKSEWLDVDRKSCIALRQALDRLGAHNISIDFSLVVPHVSLDDVGERGHFLEATKDLPFDNLWLRASGFGSDAGPLTTRKYINSLTALGIKPDWGKQPYNSIRILTKIRNWLAHGKPVEKTITKKVLQGVETVTDRKIDVSGDWQKLCTPVLVLRAHDDLDVIFREMVKASGIPLIQTLSGGDAAVTITEVVTVGK